MASDILSITEAEILAALDAARRGAASEAEGARTAQEIADDTGVRLPRVRQALAAFKKQGRLRLHQIKRVAIDDRSLSMTGYTVVPPAPAPKPKR